MLFDKVFEVEWSASQETMPKGRFPFLTRDAIAESCAVVGLEEEAVPYLRSVADRIAENPDLMRLAWHCHYLLCLSKTYSHYDCRSWPSLEEHFGKDEGAFYLLIALSGVPQAQAFHRSRGVPEQVMQDTYSDTAIWARDYRERHGVWGVTTHILAWLFNHLLGDLYRIVRLQFMQRPYRQNLHAFRSRATRKVMVLSGEGIRYRGDGQLDGTGGERDPENGWTTRFLMDNNRVVGTLIHPDGYALKGEVTLPLDEWQCILTSGDHILEVHIPGGIPMDFDAIRRSFRLAADFFPRHFPDRPFKAFCCGSWLLNTQFQDMLPPDSNIVRFQREYYLFPIRSGGRSGFTRIFRENYQDLSAAPRDTTLRRAVLDHLQAGGYLRAGGGLIFPEDLDRGTEVYRKMIKQE